MESLGIIRRFDVLEHAQTVVTPVFELLMVGPFVLQRPEEPFHDRIVVAAASTTHRTIDSQCLQDLLVIASLLFTDNLILV